jgi:hypothetical protein
MLDATSDAGQVSLGLRLAALCAEEGMRHEVQARLEAALALERFVMGRAVALPPDAGSPSELVAEVESYVRALLRDVLCGYLDADLKAVADDILIDAQEPAAEPHDRDASELPAESFEPEPGPFGGDTDEFGEIEARDLRKDRRPQLTRAPRSGEDVRPRFERTPPPEPMTFEPDLEYDYDTEPDTAEIEAVTVAPEPVTHEPVQHQLDGVTQSDDWGWDDPEDYSAPV